MITLVTAMGKNRVIGRDGGLPWNLPQELAFFKRVTLGKTLVMGRKTFDSIGRPLPGRHTVVVTRDQNWGFPGVETVGSLDQALAIPGELIIAGGRSIYDLAIPHVDRMVFSIIDGEFEGDTFFPDFDENRWFVSSVWLHDGFKVLTLDRNDSLRVDL